MSPLPLRYEPRKKATRDISEIVEYLIGEAGEQTARRMLKSLDQTIKLLCQTPMIGRDCGFTSNASSNVRRISVSAPFGNWLLFYTPTPSHIRVERVLHGAQNWSSLFP